MGALPLSQLEIMLQVALAHTYESSLSLSLSLSLISQNERVFHACCGRCSENVSELVLIVFGMITSLTGERQKILAIADSPTSFELLRYFYGGQPNGYTGCF
ncbi:unnamed protein product [Absidia cylindrospora]